MIPSVEFIERPNIVLIVLDDFDYRSMVELRPGGSTLVMDRTVERTPLSWGNAVANNPLCAPSRATIWTGQRSIEHGVETNNGAWETLQHDDLLPVWLKDAGYLTAHVGKFINGFESLTVPPGWVEWFTLLDVDYYEYTVSDNGNLLKFGSDVEDYQTDVLSSRAVDLVRYLPQPFFLQLDYGSPHDTPGLVPGQAVPAPRHMGMWNGAPLSHPESLFEDVSDKPPHIASLPELTPQDISHIELGRRRRYESLLSVDEGIEQIFQALEDSQRLISTVVIFVSDNGFHYGEHRIRSGKGQPYHESVHIPLRMHVPGLGPEVRVEPVSNVDLAPTILSFAQIPMRPQFTGRSLFSSTPERTGVHIERPSWEGFWTGDFKVVRQISNGFIELYRHGESDGCHRQDPMELDNAAGLACYEETLAELIAEL